MLYRKKKEERLKKKTQTISRMHKTIRVYEFHASTRRNSTKSQHIGTRFYRYNIDCVSVEQLSFTVANDKNAPNVNSSAAMLVLNVHLFLQRDAFFFLRLEFMF